MNLIIFYDADRDMNGATVSLKEAKENMDDSLKKNEAMMRCIQAANLYIHRIKDYLNRINLAAHPPVCDILQISFNVFLYEAASGTFPGTALMRYSEVEILITVDTVENMAAKLQVKC